MAKGNQNQSYKNFQVIHLFLVDFVFVAKAITNVNALSFVSGFNLVLFFCANTAQKLYMYITTRHKRSHNAISGSKLLAIFHWKSTKAEIKKNRNSQRKKKCKKHKQNNFFVCAKAKSTTTTAKKRLLSLQVSEFVFDSFCLFFLLVVAFFVCDSERDERRKIHIYMSFCWNGQREYRLESIIS